MKQLFLFYFFFLAFFQVAVAQIDHWETAIYADDNWRYLRGDEAPPSNWSALGFDDSGWQEGPGGIGYGDGDDNTIIQPVLSLFLRRSFSVADVAAIELGALHADFDDAFVAYLNGVEIARANIDGPAPSFYAQANGLHEAVMYDGGLPTFFLLEKSLLETLLNDGENTLAVQVHNFDGLASSDLTSLFFLSFGINDSSTDYGPPPSWFVPPGFSTHLPIVKIDTDGEYIPDEPAIPGEMGIIWNDDGTMNHSLEVPNELLAHITIERRGQSSLFFFPKNGFAIETKDGAGEDMDVSFLNFPEEEDWILHGPYSDKTLMRNVMTMNMAKQMGQYASRTRFVELLINNQYEGIYVMMEKIKRDENRVDIANLKPEDITGDELTGGYVFKIDKDEADWQSQFSTANNAGGEKLEFQYVSPKKSKIVPEQEAYIQAYVDSFEMAINATTFMFGGKRYDEYIDLQSFAEHFIISELSRNVDAYRISSYFHKKKDSDGGKIFAGPVWDYNISWANADYCGSPTVQGWVFYEHCGNSNPFWWGRMIHDDAFKNLLKCRWEELRQGPLHTDSIFAFIDGQVDFLSPALDRNFERWPILNEYVWPNPVVTGSYANEVGIMKSWIAQRAVWMDENMPGECSVSSGNNVFENNKIKTWPNPAREKLHVFFPENKGGYFDFQLVNVFGQTILLEKGKEAGSSVHIDVSQVSPGLYFGLVNFLGATYTERIIVSK